MAFFFPAVITFPFFIFQRFAFVFNSTSTTIFNSTSASTQQYHAPFNSLVLPSRHPTPNDRLFSFAPRPARAHARRTKCRVRRERRTPAYRLACASPVGAYWTSSYSWAGSWWRRRKPECEDPTTIISGTAPRPESAYARVPWLRCRYAGFVCRRERWSKWCGCGCYCHRECESGWDGEYDAEERRVPRRTETRHRRCTARPLLSASVPQLALLPALCSTSTLPAAPTASTRTLFCSPWSPRRHRPYTAFRTFVSYVLRSQ